MKRLRREIEATNTADTLLLPKVIGKLGYLSSDFLKRLAGYTTQDKERCEYISELFIIIEKVWKEVFMSYEGKLDFLETLEKCSDLADFSGRLKLEIDYLMDFKVKHGKFLGMLKKREMVKSQILNIAEGFRDLKEIGEMNRALSSCNNLLRRILKDLIREVEKLRRRDEDMIKYRGVDVDVLVRLDYWELEFLKKVEGRVGGSRKFLKMAAGREY